MPMENATSPRSRMPSVSQAQEIRRLELAPHHQAQQNRDAVGECRLQRPREPFGHTRFLDQIPEHECTDQRRRRRQEQNKVRKQLYK